MNNKASKLLTASKAIKVNAKQDEEIKNTRNSMPNLTFKSQNLNSNRKETKYMEISFSNDNASHNDGEAVGYNK